MAQRYIFVNNAINDSIVMYYQAKNKPLSLAYKTFIVTVMRIIIMLYGELDITNCYHTKNEKGMGGFDTNLTKYGYPQEELEKFKVNFEKYYEFDVKQSRLHVKRKNPYLNRVQKNLVDMMFCKNKIAPFDGKKAHEFYNMLFTGDSKDFYRRTYAFAFAKNPYEVSKYFRKKMYLMSNKLTFVPIVKRQLSNEIYELLGVNTSLVPTLTQKQVDYINQQIYNYYQVDERAFDKDTKLLEAITISKKRPIIRMD